MKSLVEYLTENHNECTDCTPMRMCPQCSVKKTIEQLEHSIPKYRKKVAGEYQRVLDIYKEDTSIEDKIARLWALYDEVEADPNNALYDRLQMYIEPLYTSVKEFMKELRNH